MLDLISFFVFNLKFHFIFKLKDINEFNKRIVNSFFHTIARSKEKLIEASNEAMAISDASKTNLQSANEVSLDRRQAFLAPPNWFFVICTTNSKQSIDPSLLSHFNFELEVKVGKL